MELGDLVAPFCQASLYIVQVRQEGRGGLWRRRPHRYLVVNHVAAHRAAIHAGLPRNGTVAQPLLLERLDLAEAHVEAAFLPFFRCDGWWHRLGNVLCRLRLRSQLRSLAQRTGMTVQHPLQCIIEILEQMKAVGDLHRVWRTLGGALGVVGEAIPADDFNLRMLLEPGRHRRRRTVRQQIDDTALLEIDQERAVRLALAFCIKLSRPVTEPARLQNRA